MFSWLEPKGEKVRNSISLLYANYLYFYILFFYLGEGQLAPKNQDKTNNLKSIYNSCFIGLLRMYFSKFLAYF
jgi:hypothetical protein